MRIDTEHKKEPQSKVNRRKVAQEKIKLSELYHINLKLSNKGEKDYEKE